MSRWVLFDAVGTLIYPEPSVAQIYLDVGRSFGWQLSPDELPARFSAAMSECFVAGRATDEASEYGTWLRVVQQVMAELSSDASQAAFEQLWQHFARPSSWRVFDDVSECWAQLSDRGYQIVVASNFDQRLVDIAAGHEPFGLVQRIFVSSQLGWSKPDPRFYLAIQAELQVGELDEFWMVGDDYENDVLAASQLGIRPIWLRRGDEEAANSIQSLDDLSKAIGARRW